MALINGIAVHFVVAREVRAGEHHAPHIPGLGGTK
jgi:hypothetical protein